MQVDYQVVAQKLACLKLLPAKQACPLYEQVIQGLERQY